MEMKNHLAGLLLLAGFALTAHSQSTVPLRFIQSIPLPNVDGFLDHMGVDVRGRRLFTSDDVDRIARVLAERGRPTADLDRPAE